MLFRKCVSVELNLGGCATQLGILGMLRHSNIRLYLEIWEMNTERLQTVPATSSYDQFAEDERRS